MNLNYKIQDDEDFYKILGCHISSSAEQIMTEYKKKVISAHPDKNPEDINAKERFELLQLAKDTLIDEKMRQKYNNWLNCGFCLPWKDWLRHSNSHQMVFHWAIKKPDAMLESKNKDLIVVSSAEKVWTNSGDNSTELLRKFRNYDV